jgi:AsmA protein
MVNLRDSLNNYRGRTMSRRRTIVVGTTLLILIPILIISLVLAQFDPNRFAPEIAAAVDKATGRHLVFGAPLRMQVFSLTPQISVENVSLSNPPGFSTPYLLTVTRVEARVGLLPLLAHRLNILSLHLVEPSVTLERGPEGSANWDFTPRLSASSGQAGVIATGGHGYEVALKSVDVENGRVTIEAGQHGPLVINLPNVTGTAASLTSNLALAADATVNGTAFHLSGTLGPVASLSATDASPWPVDLVAQMGAAQAHVQGSIAQPRAGTGYDFQVNLSVPSLNALTRLISGQLAGVPDFQGVTAAAHVYDQGAPYPAIDQVNIQAGPSDLSVWRPGLKLTNLTVTMASLNAPIAIQAYAMQGSNALSLAATLGAPAIILSPASATAPGNSGYPVSVSLQDGNARLTAAGALATPQNLAGAALAISGNIPDLSTLSALTGANLPAIKNLVFQGSLTDPGGFGMAKGVALDDVTLTSDAANLSGDARLDFGAAPSLTAALDLPRLNLDTLLTDVPPSPAPAVAPTASTGTVPGAAQTIIPDIQLPLSVLKSGSANLQLAADSVIWNKITFSGVQAGIRLTKAVLTIAPLSGEMPGGSLSATASVDSSKEPATETFAANAPALALGPLLGIFDLPGSAEGTMQAQFSGSSTGDSLPAAAASLNGQVGLALVNGSVDGATLDALFGNVLHSAGLPDDLAGAQGPATMRCLALRIDAASGVASINALALDSNRLRLTGGGSVNLANETLAISLAPQVRLADTPLSIPLQIGGSFASPTISAAAQTGAPVTNFLQQDAQALLNKVTGQPASQPDICPAALTLARLGAAGPTPAPVASNASATLQPASTPKNLLNALLGK